MFNNKQLLNELECKIWGVIEGEVRVICVGLDNTNQGLNNFSYPGKWNSYLYFRAFGITSSIN